MILKKKEILYFQKKYIYIKIKKIHNSIYICMKIIYNKLLFIKKKKSLLLMKQNVFVIFLRFVSIYYFPIKN